MPCASPHYVRHRPEQTVLHALVREHWGAFLRHTSEHYARPLPAYVRRAFEHYVVCGLPEFGFLRLRCDDCGHDRVVAFSCKERGLCPSCAGRTMANTGAHIVDRVLPNLPVRQWVLTLPFALRARAAKDPALVSAIDRLLFREVERWMRAAAGPRDGKAGSLTFVQRFGGSLNLHVHFHTLFVEGLFTRASGAPPVFHPAPPPTRADLLGVLGRVRTAVLRWVERHPRENEVEPDALDACASAAVQPGLFDRIDTGKAKDDAPHAAGGGAKLDGFDLHGSVRVGGDDDVSREKLVRYCARPAFALERLSVLPDGRVAYRIKQARKGGATHRILTPIEALARIAALIPPPRFPFLRYHGVLGPSSKLRADIVPRPERSPGADPRRDKSVAVSNVVEPTAPEPRTPVPSNPPHGSRSNDAAPPKLAAEPPPRRAEFAKLTHEHTARLAEGDLLARTPRIEWSKLLRRTFGAEILLCPRCSGRSSIVAAIQDPAEARRYLTAIGELSAPRPSGARDPDDDPYADGDDDVAEAPPPDD